MFFAVTSAVVIVYFLRALFFVEHERIEGIYSRPGPLYWLKWLIFYVLYRLRTKKAKRFTFDFGSDLRFMEDENIGIGIKAQDDNYGVEQRSKLSPNMMERVRKVEDSPHAIDAVYFNGFEEKSSSIKDEFSMCLGFTKRYRNCAEILFVMHVPGVGFLQHPSHPDRIICDVLEDDYVYHGQGISIEMLEPMRRWRISYNGLMRVMKPDQIGNISNESDELLHIKMSFIWTAYTHFIDFDSEISASCMANAFATELWDNLFFKNIEKYHSQQTHYEQWGQYMGTIQIENQEPTNLILRGARDRSFSKRDWNHFHRYIIFMIRLEDGTSISVTVICMDATLSCLSFGYIIHPNRRSDSIKNIDLKMWEYGEDGNIPREILFNFVAGNRSYSVFANIRIITLGYNCGFHWEGRVHENLADFYVNGISGRGIAQFYYRQPSMRTEAEIPKSHRNWREESERPSEIIPKDSITLKFSDKICAQDELVGGKGSQLAVLANWSSECGKFDVPSGFCVTTRAFEMHLENNPNLKKTISELDSATVIDIKSVGQRAISELTSSSLSSEICLKIEDEYKKLNTNEDAVVAVRSSAVGEDSTDLSAAGQLETYLGIKGINEVVNSILKCWGSQYSYQAVQYRKQHGQPVFSSIGVVIQIMVEQPQTSGVLFTQHPVTGHPAQMMINANYGLGETVVSGCAEPDTIVVSCLPNKGRKILTTTVGSKEEKMLVDESGGVKQIPVSAQEANIICMNDEEIFQLIDIGADIQEYYGSPRDIEWAKTSDGKIYLLQSRPITTDFTENEYEILHEFDTAFPSENFWVTTANISEMMSGAMTPLTSSIFLRAVNYSIEDFQIKGNVGVPQPYCEMNLSQCLRHGFMNYMEMMMMNKQTNYTSTKESFDINIFGEVRDDISEEEAMRYHENACPGPVRVYNTLMFWKNMFGSNTEFNELIKKTEKLKLQGGTSKDCYRSISENLAEYYAETWRLYLLYAALSGLLNTVLMSILAKGNPKWDTVHYSDVAMIYGTCEDVVSADAPSFLRKTARLIRNSRAKEDFLAMTPQDAIDWLIGDNDEAGCMFRKFLDECGHRCIKEAEFHEKSWANDPVQLGSSLQAMVKNSVEESPKKLLNVQDAIKNLKTPLSTTSKFILKWLIPVARRSVGGREWGKSMAIKLSDKFKQAYWNLANTMQRDGYLPDADLMFFLTHGEIGKVLRKRSARLVTRAIRRRRLQDFVNQQIFPELSLTVPASPTDMNDILEESDSRVSIQGCPVSHGVVKGTAIIVLNLADADEIKQGDILIVRTTDVGWSPYFPLISGLVTEIGGLISHGAVVAREYGLPCIVSAKRATQLFKSDDFVLLDGGKGIVQKLERKD